jgi:hypothetical protein
MRRWRRFSDYGFARARRMVPVVLAEADLVAAALPLVFAQDTPETAPQTTPQPVALLRHTAAATPFVDARGQWLAAYVPALVRVHPFTARPAAGGDDPARMILLVDESGGFVTDDMHDARFFDPFGAPDPALQAVVDFFRQYEVSARATRTACAALAEAGLFQPLDAGDPACAGLFGVDRARLAALDDAAFLRLRAAGALDLAQAHFVGRAQLAFLRRAEAALAAGASPGSGPDAAGLTGNTPAAPAADVSDFLAALAAAQDDAQNGVPGPVSSGPGRYEGQG